MPSKTAKTSLRWTGESVQLCNDAIANMQLVLGLATPGASPTNPDVASINTIISGIQAQVTNLQALAVTLDSQ